MQLTTLASLALASAAAHALPTVQQNTLIPLAESLKTSHPEAYAAFLTAPMINLDPASAEAAQKRQAVPGDGQPNGTRPIVTPENIFVLQCSDAGFRGECLSWGAPPGTCGKTKQNIDSFFLFVCSRIEDPGRCCCCSMFQRDKQG